MQCRKLVVRLMAGAIIMISVSCDDPITAPESQPADLTVNLSIIGDTPDPDGALVSVDGNLAEPILAGESITFATVPAGSHEIFLTDIESYCQVRGANPRTVTVAGDPIDLQFELTCGGTDVRHNLAGMDILGSGYDLAGNYADLNDVMGHVIDVDALNRAGLVDQLQYERAVFETISGTTILEYTQALSVKVSVEGGGGGFSGAAGVNFESSRTSNSNYSFATVQSKIRKYGLRIPLDMTATLLRSYLTERAREALEGIDTPADADSVVRAFGTHVIRGLVVGARLDYSVSADIQASTFTQSIGAYAKASYKSVFATASLDVSAKAQEELASFSETESRRVEIYGGKSELGQNLLSDPAGYGPWLNTIDEFPAFMDFEGRGLIPLSALVEDVTRRDMLAAAISTYLSDRGVNVPGQGPIVNHFESGVEEWTCDQNGDACQVLADSLNGFAGSYVSVQDASPDDMRFQAPSAYVGDLSRFAPQNGEYGAVKFMLWTTYDPTRFRIPAPSTPALLIESPNGNIRFVLTDQTGWGSYCQPVPGCTYHTFFPGSGAVDAIWFGQAAANTLGSWQSFDVSTGMWENATDAQISASLALVSRFFILADYVDGTDETANLDEVKLCSPGNC